MAQKEAVMKRSLVHKVFLDFLTYVPPKLRSETVEATHEVVVYLAHTHDGASVAMHSTPKDRKVTVEKVANDLYFHLVLLVAFDCEADNHI